MPDAGNGISTTNGNKPITWNAPTDANFSTKRDPGSEVNCPLKRGQEPVAGCDLRLSIAI